ncbi:MAG: flagellar basal body L-ring protein FlgH [Pseudomonadota bacterium]
MARLSFLIILTIALSACTTVDRIKSVGSAPDLTPTQNPAGLHGTEPISLPMPANVPETYAGNSLWQNGRKSFFKDQRAQTTGDIVTVVINIDDRARLDNSTERTRANGEQAAIPAFGGLEQRLVELLPDGANASDLIDLSSGSTSRGEGRVDRQEEVRLRVAAVVTDVLPNGNLAIAGRQEVRVNYEVRELTVTGVIRPEDITNANTINHIQIAEARISYGGRGQLTDVQQPRYGQQIYDILFPF